MRERSLQYPESSGDYQLGITVPRPLPFERVHTIDDLERYVAIPAVPACRQLFERGIDIDGSFADGGAFRHGHGYIGMDMDRLSPQNRAVILEKVQEQGARIMPDGGEYDLHASITFSLSEKDTIGAAKKRILEAVKPFVQQQRNTWYGYTLEELEAIVAHAEPVFNGGEFLGETLPAQRFTIEDLIEGSIDGAYIDVGEERIPQRLMEYRLPPHYVRGKDGLYHSYRELEERQGRESHVKRLLTTLRSLINRKTQ